MGTEIDAGLVTRGGVELQVARARRQDEADLKAFFGHLTPEDLRFRFLETVKEVSDARIAAMVEDKAVVTFLARHADDGQLIAIATLAEGPDGREAEVALSTHPDWKHRGVSWTLLEHVLAYAKDRGFRRVSSLEAADNREAVKLEREMGFVARLESADPVELLVSKDLSDL